MKKLFIALGLVLSVVTFANAQQGQGAGRNMGTPEERATRSIAQLESLNLTASQKSQLTQIYIVQGKQVDSLRATMQGQSDMQAMRAKMSPMQEATNKKVYSVLTEDQRKAYDAMMEARRSKAGAGAGAGAGPKAEGAKGAKKKN